MTYSMYLGLVLSLSLKISFYLFLLNKNKFFLKDLSCQG